MKKVVPILLIWVNTIEIVLYLFNKKSLNEDILVALHFTPYKKVGILSLNYLLLFYPPFRSVFIYRVIRNNRKLFILKLLIKRPLQSIELFGDIGGGLLILHKQGCVVYAERVGKCFTVSQGVTIGKGHPNKEGRDAPVIGNNVRVCPNSVIFGGIDIGDNVVIGAGTVLNKSVPNNCTVVGNPAKIIKMNGEKCDFPLV